MRNEKRMLGRSDTDLIGTGVFQIIHFCPFAFG